MSSDKSVIDKENDPELPLRYYCRPMEEKCGRIFRTREGLCKLLSFLDTIEEIINAQILKY